MVKHWEISPYTFEDYEHADVNHHMFHKYKYYNWIKFDKLYWDCLSINPHPCSIQMLQQNPDKIHWGWLSANPHPLAIQMLQQNPDKIHWGFLSMNPHPWAIQMLQQNPDKINWRCLSTNPHPWAIQMLQQNPGKIRWMCLSRNPEIFETYGYHYSRIVEHNGAVCTEIRAERMHPRYCAKWSGWGF